MIKLEEFNENNRSKTVGSSLYRICNTDPKNGSGKWYIHETYNDGVEWSRHNAHYNESLEKVLSIFNGIKSEKEIVSMIP